MAKRAAKVVVADPQAAIRSEFIKQGDDPAIARKALDDATAVSRALWLSFLTFGTYLVITFAGVDHRDLLLETPITLPVLNAPLPLVTFFWVAPILFVIFHLYLLLSLKLLADQVHSYVEKMDEAGLDQDAQDRARLQLPNFVVVQVLGGTSTQLNSWAGWLMRFTAWLTLAAGPIILLLFAQLMFLPYHGWGVTMAQRATVVIDLVFIWYFWWAIKRPQREGFPVLSGVASAGVVVITFFGLMYPGEAFYGPLAKSLFVETNWQAKLGEPVAPWEAEEESALESMLKHTDFGVFYNTLVLPSERVVGDELYEKLESQNKKNGIKPWDGERSFENLKNRDFRNADFQRIDLRKANLSNSVLVGANLYSASLQGILLDGANMEGSSLTLAFLQGGSLAWAELYKVSLDGASMQGTNLYGVRLDGAYMSGVNFNGSDLRNASLEAATLVRVSMQGANLTEVPQLNAAMLINVNLNGAALDGAEMEGSRLENVSLLGASLHGTRLDSAKFESVTVWRNVGKPSDENLADMSGLQILRNPKSVHDEEHRFSTETYIANVKEALIGVPEHARQTVVDALAVIDPTKGEPNDATNWPQVIASSSTPQLVQRVRWDTLGDIACQDDDVPFVATAIAVHHIGNHDRDGLPLIEKLLAGCPGTVGMEQWTIDQLEILRKQFLSQGKAFSNSEAN